jgi:hypothetical protein
LARAFVAMPSVAQLDESVVRAASGPEKPL